MTPRRRNTVFADKLWNHFKGDPDKPYMFQPRVNGIDEKILTRVAASQIEPEIWVTSKLGGRQANLVGGILQQVVRLLMGLCALVIFRRRQNMRDS